MNIRKLINLGFLVNYVVFTTTVLNLQSLSPTLKLGLS